MRGNGFKWKCLYCGHTWVRCQKGQPRVCPGCKGKKEERRSIRQKLTRVLVRHREGFEYLGRVPVVWRQRQMEENGCS